MFVNFFSRVHQKVVISKQVEKGCVEKLATKYENGPKNVVLGNIFGVSGLSNLLEHLLNDPVSTSNKQS